MSELNAPVDETVDVDLNDAVAEAFAPEAEETDAPEAPDADTDAPEQAEPVAERDAVSDPTPAPEPPEPFTFKAFKQDYEVPGLAFDKAKNAIVVQDARGLDRLKQMLSHGREWEARGRQELVQLRKEVQTLQTQPHAELEHAKAYMDEWNRLMQLDDQSFLEMALALKQQHPLLQAKAERAYAERLIEQQRQMAQPPEPDVDVIVEQAQAGAAELVQQMLANQPWASPDVAAELTEYLSDPRVLDQYVARALRDLPDQGISKGQYVADWDRARELAEKLAKPYRTAHERTATVQQQAAQTTKIAQQNAAKLAQAKPVPAKAAPSPSRPVSPTRPMSTEEIRRKIDADMDRTWRDTIRR